MKTPGAWVLRTVIACPSAKLLVEKGSADDGAGLLQLPTLERLRYVDAGSSGRCGESWAKRGGAIVLRS
jgi:hypothetical protein